jgi:hypothetical protein
MFKLNDGNDIDNQETRDEIVAKAYRKAGPFVPDAWIGRRYCQKCDLIGREWCHCKPEKDETITLTAPPSTPFGDLVYWHQRASKLAPGRDIIVTTARK